MSIAIATQSDSQNHFTHLLEQHRGIIIKVAGSYCWHQDDRDELMQEIAMQLWRAFDSYDPSRSFSTWMYRVALNASISWVRKNSIRMRYLTELDEDAQLPATPTPATDEDGRIAFLQRFIASLKPVDRALMLLYLEEQSYSEIADVLGISETNVATKISRLKKRVREQSTLLIDSGEHHGTR